eukprot:COSAG02_NODE_111_length_36009_cov_42.221248_17_plen_111_part_00
MVRNLDERSTRRLFQPSVSSDPTVVSLGRCEKSHLRLDVPPPCEVFSTSTDDDCVCAAHRTSSTQLCLAATLRRRKRLVLSLVSGTRTQVQGMRAGASQQVVECVAKLSI